MLLFDSNTKVIAAGSGMDLSGQLGDYRLRSSASGISTEKAGRGDESGDSGAKASACSPTMPTSGTVLVRVRLFPVYEEGRRRREAVEAKQTVLFDVFDSMKGEMMGRAETA